MMISRDNDPKIALFQLGKLLHLYKIYIHLLYLLNGTLGWCKFTDLFEQKKRALTHSYYIDIY